MSEGFPIQFVPEGYEKLEPEDNINRTTKNFRFFISNDRKIIYKMINHSNSRFEKTMEDRANVELFKQVITGELFDDSIRIHIIQGFDLESNGSHKSRFVEGCRLDTVSSDFPDHIEKQKMQVQCNILLDALIKIDSQGKLFGDWALHNLIYSNSDDIIYNIDLEGFVTYNPMPDWANIDHITQWIENIPW